MSKRLSAVLRDPELIQAVEQAAAEHDSQAAVIRAALRAYLDVGDVDQVVDHRDPPRDPALIQRVDDLERRVAALEPVSDAEIRGAVGDLTWDVEVADTEQRRTAVADAAIALRDAGRLSMSELREHVDDVDLGPASERRLLRLVTELPWVEHGGQGAHYYRWKE